MPRALKIILILTVGLYILDFLSGGRWIGGALALYTPAVTHSFQLWRLLTYALVHDLGSPLHILFNMLMLYMFGVAVTQRTGEKLFVILYIGAAGFAGLCSILWDTILGQGVSYVGASGAVYGVMVAFAYFYPRQKMLLFFIVPVEAVWAVAIFIGIDFLMLSRSDGIAHITHLGGALFGYLCVRYSSVFDKWILQWENRHRTREEKKHQMEILSRQKSMEEVDAILAKISASGLDSLTSREKETLERASREKRERKIIPGNFGR